MKNKKVLIISTSLRKGGNSDVLAEYFKEGAISAGHNVEKVTLSDQNIRFCKGCLICQQKKPCVIQDDANAIIQKIKEANVVAFATPVYFYEMSGQMKTLLDRTNPLFVDDYQFRDIYLLATCADQMEKSIENLIHGIQGWIDCFEKSQLKGVIKGVGINQYGEAKQHTSILDETYRMGKSV